MRHSEQRERARVLLEQTKKDGSSPSSPTPKVNIVSIIQNDHRIYLKNLLIARNYNPNSAIYRPVTKV